MAKTAFEAFNEDFFRELKQARNQTEAYERATNKFEQQHGFVAVTSFDSYRKRRDRKRN